MSLQKNENGSTSSPKRKQWTLHDGPKSSLRRLRNQLASEGCSESQLSLAKQLLFQEHDPEVDEEENQKIGVYWLIKASEQGSTEATNLLIECLESCKGITNQNVYDVKACIAMTQEEKLARKAAKDLFASLSNGEDFVTSLQLQEHLRQITGEDASKSNQCGQRIQNCSYLKNQGNGMNKLQEDHFISAAVHYSQSQLPLVSKVLRLRERHVRHMDTLSTIDAFLLNPHKFIMLNFYELIKFISRLSLSSLLKPELLFTNFLIFYLLFMYIGNVISLLPFVLFYCSFIAMVIYTCQIIYLKHDYIEYASWSQLFSYYCPELDVKKTESQFIFNHLSPFWKFFISFLVNLGVHPFISFLWIPQSELTIISALFMFILLFTSFSTSNDFTVFLSLALNLLLKYNFNNLAPQNWNFLSIKVPSFESYISVSAIDLLSNGKTIICSLMFLLLLKLAAKDKWIGTFTFFIPHCVCLSWLQLFVIHSQGAVLTGLIRGCFALIASVALLPLLWLSSLIVSSFSVTKLFSLQHDSWVITLQVGLFLLALILTWLFAKFRLKKLSILLFCLLIFSAIYSQYEINFKNLNTIHKEEQKSQSLAWEEYHSMCLQPSEEISIALTQLHCLQFDGMKVKWEGYVSNVRIHSVQNIIANIIDNFPNSVKTFLTCLFGTVNSNCTDKISCPGYALKKCSLERWNRYTTEIFIRMHAGIFGKTTQISIFAKHPLSNFTLYLKPNDRVLFEGEVKSMSASFAGLSGIKIQANSLTCVNCEHVTVNTASLHIENGCLLQSAKNATVVSGKYILNRIFEPFVLFK